MSVVFVLGLVACSDSTGPQPPPGPPPPLPVIEVTRNFGDSPLTGELVLIPLAADPASHWEYGVDLDGDGEDGLTGSLAGEVRLPYRFEDPGVHPLEVTLRFGEEERVLERTVVVNDPEAVRVVGQVAVPGVAFFEGVVVDGDDLYVGDGQLAHVYHMDPMTLEVKDTVAMGPGVIQGMDVSPAGDELYVIDKQKSLTVVSLPELTKVAEYGTPVAGEFFLDAESSGTVLISGGGLGRIDPATGEILLERHIEDGWSHALAPDEQTVALFVHGEDDQGARVMLLESQTFATIWETPVDGLELHAGTFDDTGERIYVFGYGDDDFRLLVLHAVNGSLLADLRLDPAVEQNQLGTANPVATTANGQYIVFSSRAGAYFVDTELGLPIFRTEPSTGCCNVAAGADGVYVVIADFVFRLRVVG